MKTKTDLQRELPGTWLCFQNKIWQKQQKPWPILTTMRIGAQKTKARKTKRRSTVSEYVQGRERKQSQQNCTPSCKKVELTLTNISNFQKRWQKKRKKDGKKERNMQTWRIRIHSSLQSEIFQISLMTFQKDAEELKNRKPTHPKPWKWWQHDNLPNCITNELSQPWMCICPSYLALIKNES